MSADCIEAGKVGTVSSYDAVVLGSAVYIKRWRGDAKHFLRKLEKELSQRPFWVFSSGPVGDPSSDADPSWLEPPKIIDQVTRLGARQHVVFGGRLPDIPRGPMEHAMVKNARVPRPARLGRDSRVGRGHRIGAARSNARRVVPVRTRDDAIRHEPSVTSTDEPLLLATLSTLNAWLLAITRALPAAC